MSIFPLKKKPVKWIQDIKMHKGALHKALGVPEGQKIPANKLKEALNSKDPHIQRMARFAMRLKGFNG